MIREILHDNYDKLLHVSLTFFAFVWLCKFTSWMPATCIVFGLQIAKTVWNYLSDSNYMPYGDWAANSIGYLTVYLYLGV